MANFVFAEEQRGALILNKEPIYEFEDDRKNVCISLYDVKADKDVADMRDYRDFFCQGRYTVILRGDSGRTVTLFDRFNFESDSGFLILIKKDNKKIWVNDIELIPSGKWVNIKGNGQYGDFEAFYQASPQFSQRISSVKWGKWWSGPLPN